MKPRASSLRSSTLNRSIHQVAFRREAHVEFGGPFGGNGGQGGDVVFLGTEGDNTLAKVRPRGGVD